jgi:hypothetical protein
MKRRELLGKMAVMTSGGVLMATVPGKANENSERYPYSDVTVSKAGQHVIFASQTGAKLDSNVHTGGGTDDTAILQSVLDKSKESGSLYLVMDGAALVRGLDIHSNTTIECLNPSCGFFMAAQSNRAIIRNANPKMTDGRPDKNITLLGGTYNHNCKEQVHNYIDKNRNSSAFGKEVWVIGMEFYGVENFTMRDVTIRNQRTFALLMANWFRVTIENIFIDLPDHADSQNQDGLHFWGPGQFLTMKNIQGRSGDDFIALAPDENDLVSDITDVLIDGVILDNADQGIRLLSRNEGRLDRIIIKNVTGTYRSFGFYINPWFNDGNGGNFGNIVFDTIDLRQSEPNYHYTPPMLFRLGGRIESLTLRNIYHHKPSDNRSVLDIGWPGVQKDNSDPETFIKSLLVDGLHIFETDEKSSDASYIKVMGHVENLIVRNVEIRRDENIPIKGCLIETTIGTRGAPGIKNLFMTNILANRMNCLISHKEGEIDSIQVSNIMCSDMGDAFLAADRDIGQMNSSSVFGVRLISVKSKGKIKYSHNDSPFYQK